MDTERNSAAATVQVRCSGKRILSTRINKRRSLRLWGACDLVMHALRCSFALILSVTLWVSRIYPLSAILPAIDSLNCQLAIRQRDDECASEADLAENCDLTVEALDNFLDDAQS